MDGSINLIFAAPNSSADSHDGVLAGPWHNRPGSCLYRVAGQLQLLDSAQDRASNVVLVFGRPSLKP
jgi:hypothetical protein